jgi:hypothetical protein
MLKILNITNLQQVSVYTQAEKNSRSIQYLSFFIHQLMHKWIVLKTILKFTLKLTLKQLRHKIE